LGREDGQSYGLVLILIFFYCNFSLILLLTGTFLYLTSTVVCDFLVDPGEFKNKHLPMLYALCAATLGYLQTLRLLKTNLTQMKGLIPYGIHIEQPVHPFICLSVCLSAYLSVCLPVCLSVCLNVISGGKLYSYKFRCRKRTVTRNP
jgi:hypothetical protein